MAEDPNVFEHTISRVPASDITTLNIPVDIDSTNKFAASTAGGYSDGTLIDTGESPSELTAKVGGLSSGARFVRASGTCTIGAKAAVGSSGYQDAVAGQVVVGQFLSGTTTAGDSVLLRPYDRGQYRYNGKPIVAVAADGAIAVPTEDTTYFVTKAGVAAMTLVDPTSATHDGIELTFIATTANAHTLSNAAGSGFFSSGGASKDIATFGGAIGDGLTIVAYLGKWYIKPGNEKNITLG